MPVRFDLIAHLVAVAGLAFNIVAILSHNWLVMMFWISKDYVAQVSQALPIGQAMDMVFPGGVVEFDFGLTDGCLEPMGLCMRWGTGLNISWVETQTCSNSTGNGPYSIGDVQHRVKAMNTWAIFAIIFCVMSLYCTLASERLAVVECLRSKLRVIIPALVALSSLCSWVVVGLFNNTVNSWLMCGHAICDAVAAQAVVAVQQRMMAQAPQCGKDNGFYFMVAAGITTLLAAALKTLFPLELKGQMISSLFDVLRGPAPAGAVATRGINDTSALSDDDDRTLSTAPVVRVEGGVTSRAETIKEV